MGGWWVGGRGSWRYSKTPVGVVEQGGNLGGENDWAVHIFREHNKETDARAERERRVNDKK